MRGVRGLCEVAAQIPLQIVKLLLHTQACPPLWSRSLLSPGRREPRFECSRGTVTRDPRIPRRFTAGAPAQRLSPSWHRTPVLI